jgi:hypothetical protein
MVDVGCRKTVALKSIEAAAAAAAERTVPTEQQLFVWRCHIS